LSANGTPDAAAQGDEDEVLMARVAAGDHPAFCALVDRHFRRTLIVAERMMGARADADEIAQETFLRVWRAPEQWRPSGGRFAAWLYRVTVNLCLDRLRRQPEMPLESAAETADPAADAEHHLAAGEAAQLVAAAIADLPGRQKAALVLCYYEELSNAEAAKALSVSVAALEALLVRARRTLRQKLKTLGSNQEEKP
jgi:RNA polymerase sigma-70 factor, ECF subfamily